jgi:hypothetical protein
MLAPTLFSGERQSSHSLSSLPPSLPPTIPPSPAEQAEKRRPVRFPAQGRDELKRWLLFERVDLEPAPPLRSLDMC